MTLSVTAGLAAAGLVVGLMGPKVVEGLVLKMNAGGKFGGVSLFRHCS